MQPDWDWSIWNPYAWDGGIGIGTSGQSSSSFETGFPSFTPVLQAAATEQEVLHIDDRVLYEGLRLATLENPLFSLISTLARWSWPIRVISWDFRGQTVSCHPSLCTLPIPHFLTLSLTDCGHSGHLDTHPMSMFVPSMLPITPLGYRWLIVDIRSLRVDDTGNLTPR